MAMVVIATLFINLFSDFIKRPHRTRLPGPKFDVRPPILVNGHVCIRSSRDIPVSFAVIAIALVHSGRSDLTDFLWAVEESFGRAVGLEL